MAPHSGKRYEQALRLVAVVWLIACRNGPMYPNHTASQLVKNATVLWMVILLYNVRIVDQ